jgi:hypothetical protein
MLVEEKLKVSEKMEQVTTPENQEKPKEEASNNELI